MKQSPEDDDNKAPALWVAIMARILAQMLNDKLILMIEYQRRELAIYKRELKKRPTLTDGDRRSLAEIAAKLGRKAMAELGSMVTPDTLMRWYRKLCVAKWVHPPKRRGRPPTKDDVRKQVIDTAQTWNRAGYTRIHDVMKALGYTISRSTVVNILREAGVPTAPHRGMSWKQFIATVMDGIYACDMFTVDTPTNTYYCLFAIKIGTREVELVNITTNPDGQWMAQQSRNLCDFEHGFLKDCRYLIHDREPTFIHQLDPILRSSGIKPKVTPVRSPNLNAFAERFVGSVRQDCLDHIPIFGERHLRHVLREYVAWYNHERPHQGLDGQYIDKQEPYREEGVIAKRFRLGGLLPHFYRAAA